MSGGDMVGSAILVLEPRDDVDETVDVMADN